ncbi:MAG: DUF3299 domain-containing protein [Bacteroidota bacterium]
MRKLFFLCLFLISAAAQSQTEISWSTLDDVTFTDKYSEEAQGYYYYPQFGKSVKELEGKQVFLKGYMLVIDPSQNIYILSRYPYASCFFCGSGGPESIVELQLKPKHPKFKMDQIVTISGTLVLNYDDIYQCNYILGDAEIYKK